MKQIFFNNSCALYGIMLLSTSLLAIEQTTPDSVSDSSQSMENLQRNNSREIVRVKKQLALMKKMVAELATELDDLEKSGGTTRSFKSVDQIFKEHEWITTVSHFLKNHAVSIISSTCAIIGLCFSYYFNKQQILLGQAQLFWAKNGAAVKYLHELARGAYGSYAKHVAEYDATKVVA